MQCKLNDLVEESAKAGLKLNSVKPKSLKTRTSNKSSIYKYKVGNETVENTDSFTNLGSVITTDGGAKADILNRTQKVSLLTYLVGRYNLLQVLASAKLRRHISRAIAAWCQFRIQI